MAQTMIPKKQYAVQLVGPGLLKLNTSKEVFRPGPWQVLAKVECVGLCFSDLKLLKEFSQHARKTEILRGLSNEVLGEIPSYVPGEKATVPGHEATVRIVAVGEKVKHHRVGERCLVQTDYRALPTANSNGSFGYNFEGALQEYVLMDERVVIEPGTGERFLIPVPEDVSASAIALVEPWACVEDSYVNPERQGIKAGGRMLVVAVKGEAMNGVKELTKQHQPGEVATVEPGEVAGLANEGFDDVLYFGAEKGVIEVLNDKLAARGIMNVVLGGKKIGKAVLVGIGRVHYGGTRWVGTVGSNAAESYRHIPPAGEIREGEKIVVIGAAGPMGQMHVIRSICSGVKGIRVVGTDMDDGRIEALAKKARALAKANGVELRLVNTSKEKVSEKFSYIALMVPVGALVAAAVRDSMDGCLINVFAGIPAPVKQELDLDTYIANRCYMFGTSGSVIRDMKIVLEKVVGGKLDTNLSVDAVSGMAGAEAGIAAVENRTLAGKILVYPMLHEMGLIPLAELGGRYPTVAEKLEGGKWCGAAEDELLRVAR